MLSVIARRFRWKRFAIDRHTRLPGLLRTGACALDALFERTHERKILVESYTILCANLRTQPLCIAQHPVEQQRVHLRPATVLSVEARNSRSYAERGLISRASGVVGLLHAMCDP